MFVQLLDILYIAASASVYHVNDYNQVHISVVYPSVYNIHKNFF